jgi:hypothetical protein
MTQPEKLLTKFQKCFEAHILEDLGFQLRLQNEYTMKILNSKEYSCL